MGMEDTGGLARNNGRVRLGRRSWYGMRLMEDDRSVEACHKLLESAEVGPYLDQNSLLIIIECTSRLTRNT